MRSALMPSYNNLIALIQTKQSLATDKELVQAIALLTEALASTKI